MVIAAGLIGWGSWYANQISEQSQAAATATAPATTPTQIQTATSTNSTSTNNMGNLQIVDTVVGTGTVAQNGDTLSMLYTGKLDNGTVFDASSLHGNQPFSFVLGEGQVIAGWDQGILGMKVGGMRELTIPPSLGYGSQSIGSIPPNSTLHFTVQLLSVSSTQQ